MGVASPLCLLVYLLCQFLSINSLVSNDPVLPVPLNVVVWTSGLKRILPAALKTQLEIILPRYFPAIEAGKPVHDIQLLLNYEVNIVADSFHLNYETFIKSKPVHANGFHMVLIDQLTSFLQEEVNAGAFGSSLNQADIFTLPVLILNTEKVAKHMIVHSEDRIAECAMSVLSSVAFLDLNAKVCDVTKSVSHESRHVRWSTPALSAPFPFTYLFSKGVAYKPENSVYNNYLTARVAGLVTSAIQVMSTGNLDWRPSHATERIFCPIVIIKNDNSNTTNTQPDLIAIQRWLKSILLPHQEVVLVSTDHYIDEHPQISVAIASSHMTFAASVLGNLETPDTHIERIPFIDTNLLFHELSSVGDKLCDLLLHQTGHSETLNALLESESIREQESDLITPKIKVGRSDLTSKEKAWRAAVIVPVFVISDLHIHHERHLSSASSGRQTAHPSARPDIPVQPLFNKNEAIAIDSDSSSVLVLHTTEPVVSTFSPHTKSWRENNLSDLDSLIAEGLTRALTGFNAPHAQLSESFDIIDLTWTHGPHPFAPFGHLSSTAADSEHSIFSTSIRRSILIARAHRAMQRSISVSHRATAIETEISDAFRYLHSLHGSSRQVKE